MWIRYSGQYGHPLCRTGPFAEHQPLIGFRRVESGTQASVITWISGIPYEIVEQQLLLFQHMNWNNGPKILCCSSATWPPTLVNSIPIQCRSLHNTQLFGFSWLWQMNVTQMSKPSEMNTKNKKSFFLGLLLVLSLFIILFLLFLKRFFLTVSAPWSSTYRS